MGTPNFSNKQTADLFDWIRSSEEDCGYFKQMTRIWFDQLGQLAPAQMLQELKEYALAKDASGEFKFHRFAPEWVTQANLCEIADAFLEQWSAPRPRLVCTGTRIGGEKTHALDHQAFGNSSAALIFGDEVAGDYGQVLVSRARELLNTQREELRELH